jgi:hypothetical protein
MSEDLADEGAVPSAYDGELNDDGSADAPLPTRQLVAFDMRDAAGHPTGLCARAESPAVVGAVHAAGLPDTPVRLGAVLEWCIEYDDEYPRLQLRTAAAWYSLVEPSASYAPVYARGDCAALHACAAAIEVLSADCAAPYEAVVVAIATALDASPAARAALPADLRTAEGARRLVAANASLLAAQIGGLGDEAMAACPFVRTLALMVARAEAGYAVDAEPPTPPAPAVTPAAPAPAPRARAAAAAAALNSGPLGKLLQGGAGAAGATVEQAISPAQAAAERAQAALARSAGRAAAAAPQAPAAPPAPAASQPPTPRTPWRAPPPLAPFDSSIRATTPPGTAEAAAQAARVARAAAVDGSGQAGEGGDEVLPLGEARTPAEPIARATKVASAADPRQRAVAPPVPPAADAAIVVATPRMPPPPPPPAVPAAASAGLPPPPPPPAALAAPLVALVAAPAPPLASAALTVAAGERPLSWMLQTSAVGFVIGPGGRKVTDLERATGAQIAIAPHKDALHGVPWQNLALSGALETRLRAEQLLRAKLCELDRLKRGDWMRDADRLRARGRAKEADALAPPEPHEMIDESEWLRREGRGRASLRGGGPPAVGVGASAEPPPPPPPPLPSRGALGGDGGLGGESAVAALARRLGFAVSEAYGAALQAPLPPPPPPQQLAAQGAASVSARAAAVDPRAQQRAAAEPNNARAKRGGGGGAVSAAGGGGSHRLARELEDKEREIQKLREQLAGGGGGGGGGGGSRARGGSRRAARARSESSASSSESGSRSRSPAAGRRHAGRGSKRAAPKSSARAGGARARAASPSSSSSSESSSESPAPSPARAHRSKRGRGGGKGDKARSKRDAKVADAEPSAAAAAAAAASAQQQSAANAAAAANAACAGQAPFGGSGAGGFMAAQCGGMGGAYGGAAVGAMALDPRQARGAQLHGALPLPPQPQPPGALPPFWPPGSRGMPMQVQPPPAQFGAAGSYAPGLHHPGMLGLGQLPPAHMLVHGHPQLGYGAQLGGGFGPPQPPLPGQPPLPMQLLLQQQQQRWMGSAGLPPGHGMPHA